MHRGVRQLGTETSPAAIGGAVTGALLGSASLQAIERERRGPAIGPP